MTDRQLEEAGQAFVLAVRAGASPAQAMGRAIDSARAHRPQLDAYGGFPDWMLTVVRDVAKRHGLKPSVIRGPRRDRYAVHARDEVVWILRQPEASYPLIGHLLNRDHSTIISAFRRFEARLEAEPELAARMIESGYRVESVPEERAA